MHISPDLRHENERILNLELSRNAANLHLYPLDTCHDLQEKADASSDIGIFIQHKNKATMVLFQGQSKIESIWW
jgi:hypothetical protein